MTNVGEIGRPVTMAEAHKLRPVSCTYHWPDITRVNVARMLLAITEAEEDWSYRNARRKLLVARGHRSWSRARNASRKVSHTGRGTRAVQSPSRMGKKALIMRTQRRTLPTTDVRITAIHLATPGATSADIEPFIRTAPV